MAIDKLQSSAFGVRPELRTEFLAASGKMRALDGAQPGQSASFTHALDKALQDTSKLQAQATALTKQFQMGDPNVSLEETMVAIQKGSLSFQMAVQVRNRLVNAYQEIMNMPV